MHCRKYESFFRKNSTTADIPVDLKKHIEECERCRDYFRQVTKVEAMVKAIPRPGLSEHKLSVMHAAVMKNISQKKTATFRSLFFLKPIPAALTAAVVVIFFLLHFNSNSGVQNHPPALNLQSEAVEDILIDQTSIYDIADDASITADFSDILIVEATSNLSEIDTIDVDPADDWLYGNAGIQSLSDFSETDWENLKRYLS